MLSTVQFPSTVLVHGAQPFRRSTTICLHDRTLDHTAERQKPVSSAVLGPKSSFQLDQLVRDAGKEPPYLSPEAFSALELRLANVGARS